MSLMTGQTETNYSFLLWGLLALNTALIIILMSLIAAAGTTAPTPMVATALFTVTSPLLPILGVVLLIGGLCLLPSLFNSSSLNWDNTKIYPHSHSSYNPNFYYSKPSFYGNPMMHHHIDVHVPSKATHHHSHPSEQRGPLVHHHGH